MTDTDTDTDAFDPALVLLGEGSGDAPRAAYRQLHEHCPVGRSPDAALPGVYVSGYDEVAWALRHPEVFSSSAEALEIGQSQPMIPVQVDPPLHTRYRALLNPMFKPKRIAELEPQVRACVTGLLDGLVARGHCNVHDELATPLPSTIFLRLMGLPLEDLPQFLRWRDDTIRPDVDPGDTVGAARAREAASQAIGAYFEAAIDRARHEPGDGLFGQIVGAELDGRPLDQAELLGICHLMLLGGLDTVTASLDCMVDYLARHPDRRQALVDNPSLVPKAVEELLRQQTPVMLLPRVVREAVTLGGVELQPGEPAVLVIGAANSDERMFPGAHEVDFGRDNGRHVAFGVGHHFCLGAHLARLELRVALEELHRRIPDYRLKEGADIHFTAGIRQATGLEIEWTP